MAKRKNEIAARSSTKSARGLRALYDKMRREFTAADLQKYTEIEDGIPMEQLIAELEAIHRQETRKGKQR